MRVMLRIQCVEESSNCMTVRGKVRQIREKNAEKRRPIFSSCGSNSCPEIAGAVPRGAFSAHRGPAAEAVLALELRGPPGGARCRREILGSKEGIRLK